MRTILCKGIKPDTEFIRKVCLAGGKSVVYVAKRVANLPDYIKIETKNQKMFEITQELFDELLKHDYFVIVVKTETKFTKPMYFLYAERSIARLTIELLNELFKSLNDKIYQTMSDTSNIETLRLLITHIADYFEFPEM